MSRTTVIRTTLIAALAATTLVGTVTSASADGIGPAGSDAYIVNPNEKGLIQLYSTPEPGQVQAMNWTGSLSGWAPGNYESRHWDDNDYTEILFTGCTMYGTTGQSVGVKLWQAVPYNLDKDMGMKTFTWCFKGANNTSRGEWNAYYTNGDQRYFTIPELNGSSSTRATVSVSEVFVDTSAAD